SINWGVWAQTRAVASGRYRRFIEQSGLRLLDNDQNLQALDLALRANPVQIGIFQGAGGAAPAAAAPTIPSTAQALVESSANSRTMWDELAAEIQHESVV